MLREMLFGSAKGPSFNSEWRCQDFTFCELPGLEYGLVQHKVQVSVFKILCMYMYIYSFCVGRTVWCSGMCASVPSETPPLRRLQKCCGTVSGSHIICMESIQL